MACEAAYAVGGDARGQQGAQLKVYRRGAGFRGTDLLVDLRVDDSTQAIPELRALWEEWKFHHLYGVGFQPIEQTTGRDVQQLQRHLRTLGYLDETNRDVFGEQGEPLGVFNDATAEATTRWKSAAGLDEGAYLVQFHVEKARARSAAFGRCPMRTPWTLVALFGLGIAPAFSQIDATREDQVMGSLGIAAYDPETGEVGVACASPVFAVGYVMAHVRAGVGAVATMGGAPYKDGPLMLDWMEDGASPEDVLERLRQRYDHIGQMSLVDAKGRSVAATENPNLSDWNGQRVGKNYAASGNILAGPNVVAGFGDSFESTAGSGLPLAERLMRALEAATRAGGDARGQMGAVLQVYKPGSGLSEHRSARRPPRR